MTRDWFTTLPWPPWRGGEQGESFLCHPRPELGMGVVAASDVVRQVLAPTPSGPGASRIVKGTAGCHSGVGGMESAPREASRGKAKSGKDIQRRHLLHRSPLTY